MGNDLETLSIHLRLVTPDDSNDILTWRNDPLTRMNSETSHEISPQEHDQWLQKALQDPARFLLMAMTKEGKKIGFIHFKEENGKTTVSLNIAPQERGKKYSAHIIHEAIEKYQLERAHQPIIARIKKDNAVSTKSFLKAGFKLVEAGDQYDIFQWGEV
ncbi:MAG: hypothetical protein COV74_09625 [Candidatus Omnitrophica bacterium CG11_big_fil_rev_8_21_14_0_20_45_26]|uniref:N-acetyltransferase domain-containing protein n=1 Tax=Candidatus Abzuiibacterium crystallinum TaxID=1974748 RepID=A0A2H0LLE5_9BACT|nr:MAG: hypothetical protein COV74_09625 [Candidatus Omnitrophica bacterium CG11_big_fil_rev_8_21_14_0_20_45_26]PIW65404.1 MAG: hypothetical protein COW12_02195 [Candidatus Omnitrophica bacterium CG12_big_fil_rev_8_21_14_0_65_45_16]